MKHVYLKKKQKKNKTNKQTNGKP